MHQLGASSSKTRYSIAVIISLLAIFLITPVTAHATSFIRGDAYSTNLNGCKGDGCDNVYFGVSFSGKRMGTVGLALTVACASTTTDPDTGEITPNFYRPPVAPRTTARVKKGKFTWYETFTDDPVALDYGGPGVTANYAYLLTGKAIRQGNKAKGKVTLVVNTYDVNGMVVDRCAGTSKYIAKASLF